MKRLIGASAVFAVGVLLSAGPALAFQCPKLISQANAAAGNRFDNAAYEARTKAAQAQKLHSEGKHADAVKAGQEALKTLGLQAS
jgi:hypothetical protein